MNGKFLLAALIIFTLAAMIDLNAQPVGSASKQTTGREVAVTFDDLPVISVTLISADERREITTRLLRSITAGKVPAVGFVNENKLLDDGARDERRVALLQMWIDSGLELGNHSFSHPDLHTTPLEKFREDVVRGEEVTRMLLQKKGKNLHYFRHPFLHTGRSLETKRAFEEFLSGRGYTVAPVTVDNSEWIFAAAYAKAAARGDKEMVKRIGAAYVPYMEQKFAYYEQQSTALFGREIKQVLLLHANAINADYFDDLARMMQKRGYKFITLDAALTDAAYKSNDTFTGPGGISWIHRWALTRGLKGDFFRGEPETPEFVMKEAGIASE